MRLIARSTRGGSSRLRRLTFERLEERALLASFVWSGGASGDFNVASNWTGPNGAGVPGAADDAVVNIPGVTIQISSSAAVNSLNTLTDTTVDVSGGTFSVADGNGARTVIGTLDVDAGAMFAVDGGAASAGDANVAGMIGVNAGGFTFNGGSATLSGAITAATGAIVDFFNGLTASVNPGASFNGPGLYVLQSAFGRPTLTLNENLSIQTLELDSGSTITGTGTLTVPGTFTDNGTLSGAGSLTVPQGGMLNGAIFIENGYTINNAGTATVTGNGSYGSATGGVFNNTGTFELQSDQGQYMQGVSGPNSVFNNSGTIIKSGIGGADVFGLQFNNTGVVNVESGDLNTGIVVQDTGPKLTGGTWNIGAGATLDINNDNVYAPPLVENDANVTLGGAGATFTNFGTLTTNAGSLTLGPGAVLNVSGTFTQTSAGTLTPQIGGSSDSGAFGQLVAAGAVTLAGALDIELVDNYAPTVADSYAVVTYPGVTGIFGQINDLSPGPGQALGARVTATEVLVSGASTAADLDVHSVSFAPLSGLPGDTADVTWNVTNTGGGAAFGEWEDAVYLSSTPTVDVSAMLLAVTAHTGGLESGDSYQGSATITLPALPPGPVYAIVVVDRRGVVLEGSTATLVAASAQPYTVNAVPTLTIGTPTAGTFSAPNQDRYFQVTVSAGQSLALSLDSEASGGSLSLSASFDVLPGPSGADATTQGSFAPNQSLVISPTQQGTYYIDVHSQYGGAASSSFTISATLPGFGLSAVSPTTIGNGPATLAVSGSGLTSDTQFALSGPSGTIPGTVAQFVSPALAYVTFDLTGAAPGAYSLAATPPVGAAATLPAALTVQAATTGGLTYYISAPSQVRAGITYSLVVTYSNTSDVDIPAPLFQVESLLGTPLMETPGDDNTSTMGAQPLVQVLGIAPGGPAGVLQPGQTNSFTLYFVPGGITAPSFDVFDNPANDPTPFDYNDFGPEIRPTGLTDAQWNAEFAEFQQMVGPTVGDYVQMLDANATLLPASPLENSNPVALVLAELDRAAAALGNSISGTLTTTDARASLANQTVVADNTTTGDEFIATTLNDGSFVIPNVTPGSYTISVLNGATS